MVFKAPAKALWVWATWLQRMFPILLRIWPMKYLWYEYHVIRMFQDLYSRWIFIWCMYTFLPVYPSSFLSGHQLDHVPVPLWSVPGQPVKERWPDVICARSTEVLGLTSKLLVWRNVEDGEWGGGLRCFEDFSIRDAWIMVNWSFWWRTCLVFVYAFLEYSILEHSCRTHAGRGPPQRLHGSSVLKKWSWQLPCDHFTALCSGGQFSLWPGIVSLDRSGGNDTSHLVVETKSSASKWSQSLWNKCETVWQNCVSCVFIVFQTTLTIFDCDLGWSDVMSMILIWLYVECRSPWNLQTWWMGKPFGSFGCFGWTQGQCLPTFANASHTTSSLGRVKYTLWAGHLIFSLRHWTRA